ncbi:uncharacterized protein DUF4957 [Mucilaginibacter yixingensis]|uniref:Uncharacterized protein DUF4957 n=1 Tax=Mucilaginibacter yixingensis TaxID=1295612 RepID=A0A2T5J972_9SPHI|nr:DUF4957 domain-containing protein [Mucilaginibacter yixingensis]PTQ96564.1 uncharacterized protein DUF4957 [Mucilaginibacter yixingensis]
MKSKQKTFQLFLLMLISLAFCACVKSIDGVVDDASTNRPFVPYSFSVKTSKDSAKFLWTAPVLSAGKRYTYTVDVAQDSTFGKIDFTKTLDTLGFVVVDPTLTVAKKYFARLRVNGFKGSQPSNYYYLTKPFSIPGLNYLRVIRDFEVTPTTALIHWYTNANTTDINKVVLSVDGVQAASYDISPAENASGAKLLDKLTPNTKYSLQVFAGTKSKGTLSFATPKTLVFTTILNSGGDLAGAITAAADGDVIGLNPGTYTLSSIYTMTGKSVTIASVSNKPADTKVKVRELDVLGTNGGINLIGLDLDGNYSGTSYGTQFLVIKGAAAGGDPANFADVRIDNCYIHDFTRCLLIANNATTVNTQTIKSFTINNCIIYNIDKAGTSTYYTLSMEKLLFNNLNITKSTFYNMGAGMINMGTTLAASTILPTINIDYCTFNNFGGSNKYLLIDANNNKISYTLKNSILANSPQAGSINGTAFRGTGAGSVLDFLNNDYFQLNSTAGATTPLVLTGLNQVACLSINLGWTATTQNFSLAALPDANPVLTLSSSANTVGDPRWAY